MKKLALLLVCVLAGCAANAGAGPASFAPAGRGVPPPFVRFGPNDLQLQTLDAPLHQFPDLLDTAPTGIRSTLITATLTDIDKSTIGVVYDDVAGTWTPIEYPGAGSTAAYGPAIASSGYRIVGSYKLRGQNNDHGFVYESSTGTYVTLDAPAALCAPKPCNFTIAHSSYGETNYRVVGNFDAVTGTGPPKTYPGGYPASGHAFMYDAKNARFAQIDVPGKASTTAYGIWIDGTTVAVAGGFTDSKGVHAYVWNLSSGKLFPQIVYNYPKAAVTHFEGITGAGGAGNYNVVGDYSDVTDPNGKVYGFYLTIRNWQAGAPVIVGPVSANSVFNRSIVGVYTGAGLVNGYIAKAPAL